MSPAAARCIAMKDVQQVGRRCTNEGDLGRSALPGSARRDDPRSMSTASGPLNGHAYFVHWGVVQISAANLITIAIMIVLFVLAVLLRLPSGHGADKRPGSDDVQD